MGHRISILKWTDCQYLHKLMSRSQEELMKFACRGFKESGIGDDMFVVCSLIDLRNQINVVLERFPKKEEK